MKEYPECYLGDGVYASFDGYQIWLRTERENGWQSIALEPSVYSALTEYVKALKGTQEVAHG